MNPSWEDRLRRKLRQAEAIESRWQAEARAAVERAFALALARAGEFVSPGGSAARIPICPKWR